MKYADRPIWQIHVGATVGCCTLVALVYFAWIGPHLSQRLERIRQSAEIITVQNKAEVITDDLDRLQIRLTEAKAAVQQATLAERSTAGLNGRIARLTELAGAHQLQIDGIEPGEPVKNPRNVAIPLRLNGSGGYRNVAAMLAHVRTALPDMGVDQIEMTGGAPGSTPTFIVHFQWFTQADSIARGG
jgi:Tfp pilus assembly protein PilO